MFEYRVLTYFCCNRGKFVTALGMTWCPQHFVCAMDNCRCSLTDVGFVEEQKQLYCETCFESYLAPICARCQKRIKGVSSTAQHQYPPHNLMPIPSVT